MTSEFTDSSLIDLEELIDISFDSTFHAIKYSTLCKFPNCLIKQIIDQKVSEGYLIFGGFFFDRDGVNFKHILNYMITGHLNVYNHSLLKELLIEAEYFHLDCLKELIIERLYQCEKNKVLI